MSGGALNTPLIERELRVQRAVDSIFELEREIRSHPQVEMPVEHFFSKGLYARELRIPAGIMLTGHLHKQPQLNILMQGEISVLVGDRIERLVAPKVVCSPAGTKRIAYAHSDVVWLTVLATEETNIEKIEDQFLAKTEDEYREWLASQATPIASA